MGKVRLLLPQLARLAPRLLLFWLLPMVLAACAPTLSAAQPAPASPVTAQSANTPAVENAVNTAAAEITETNRAQAAGRAEPTKTAEQPAAGQAEAATQPPAGPTTSPTPAGTPTPDTRKLPKYWAEWPLIPTLSARAKEIFLLGQQLGNDPHSFTTIGDCQSEPNIFMGTYDTDSYQLAAGYESLNETIQWYKGSFARDSITVKDGMSVASVFAPGWADPKQCQAKETPLECEFRLHKPSIVFINLGTNWKGGDEVKHAEYMRKIVDFAISRGVLPILSTKGDNLEGGHRINQSIAQIAYDYDLPLWNFWLSIRDLPGKGIDGTRPGGYLIPEAWGRRSFTGLQALDAVWRALKPIMK